MSELLANVGWLITGIAVVGCIIMYPALLLIFGAIFGLMYLINPKL